MKHTVRSMYAAAGVSIVGNVAYLSNKALSPQALGKLSRTLPRQEWFQKVCRDMRMPVLLDASTISGWMSLETLHLSMERRGYTRLAQSDDPFEFVSGKHEPSWMVKLPTFAKRYLRCQFAIVDGIDPFAIVLKFPYMGFGYIIPDDGLAADADRAFKLGRLRGIRQLSFLHDPVLTEVDRGSMAMMFEHTRFCHSLDVHAVANLIAINIGLKSVELNTILTAAISHDTLTPAGGDSVKLIDPAAFDEDAHYPELLVGDDWVHYRQTYGIDKELLISTINGEGLLGRILDIADKSSYLARDTFAYLGAEAPKASMANPAFYVVADIVAKDPYVCAVWESAHRRNGSLVFGNTERMARFLKLRALMFRNLYYNPYSRFFEYLVGKGVVKQMYRQGTVTREQLLTNGDDWIEGKIDEFLDTQMFMGMFHDLEHARIEECSDMDTATRRVAEFANDDSVIVIPDDFQVATSNGTKKFLVRKGNQAVPFNEACPKDTEEIESIMTFSRRVRLYYIQVDDLRISTSSARKIKSSLRQD